MLNTLETLKLRLTIVEITKIMKDFSEESSKTNDPKQHLKIYQKKLKALKGCLETVKGVNVARLNEKDSKAKAFLENGLLNFVRFIDLEIAAVSQQRENERDKFYMSAMSSLKQAIEVMDE